MGDWLASVGLAVAGFAQPAPRAAVGLNGSRPVLTLTNWTRYLPNAGSLEGKQPCLGGADDDRGRQLLQTA
jgi:hypothetical protein